MTYVLLSRLRSNLKIKIGRLGDIDFERGYYLYVGSAKKSLDSRIKRHLSKKKTLFWHIDYLLSARGVTVDKVWVYLEDKECVTAQLLLRGKYIPVERFGSSDCQCLSHLFFSGNSIFRAKAFLERIGYRKYAN